MSESQYSSKQLARLSLVSLRQIQYWSENGLLRPVIVGQRRIFFESDIRRARILRQLDLRAYGLRCKNVRSLVNRLAMECAGYAVLSPDGKKARFCLTKGDVLKAGSSLNGPFRLIEIGGESR